MSDKEIKALEKCQFWKQITRQGEVKTIYEENCLSCSGCSGSCSGCRGVLIRLGVWGFGSSRK